LGWDGFITQVDEFIDAGDKIVVLGRYIGMYKATGRAIDAPVCIIYTVRSGRIVKFQQYTDTAPGTSPTPTTTAAICG
jgi:ketosteroid isomerase-like protein